MATVLKIHDLRTGRTWNACLKKYEDECTEEELKIANVIQMLEKQMDRAAHDNRLDIVNTLAGRVTAWEEVLKKGGFTND